MTDAPNPDSPAPEPSPPARRRRSDRLLAALAPFRAVLVVAHDTPDPDAIAGGWGLHRLVTKKLAKPVRLVAGGAIVRAENRQLVRLCGPPLELVESIVPAEDEAIVFVDAAPEAGNHVLFGTSDRVTAVIDHHASNRLRTKVCFRDYRPKVAASASIVAQYLRHQDVAPSTKLATAMLYAIRTETTGSAMPHSGADRTAINWLTPRADPSLLAEILNAPLARDYFGDLALALQNTFVYGEAALCLLPRASGAEIVGEVADLLVRAEGIRRVLCGAIVEGDVIVSVRTLGGDDDAAALVQRALAGLGRGGGHRRRAGGQITLDAGHAARLPTDLQDRLRSQWLDACGVDRQQRGTRLVARRDIVGAL